MRGSTGYASGSTKAGLKDPNLELQKPHQKMARVTQPP